LDDFFQKSKPSKDACFPRLRIKILSNANKNATVTDEKKKKITTPYHNTTTNKKGT